MPRTMFILYELIFKVVWVVSCGVVENGKKKGESQKFRVNPNSLSSPFPLPLSFARSRESKGCPNSRLDRGVGLRGRGR